MVIAPESSMMSGAEAQQTGAPGLDFLRALRRISVIPLPCGCTTRRPSRLIKIS